MTAEALHELTLADARDALGAGDVSAVEIVRSLADRIERVDGEVRAYLRFDRERLEAGAREADALRAKGDARSLLGVPIAVKDVINVAGEPCTCGSRILERYVAPYDAHVVERLRAVGAVPAGRTNMDEFAMGSSTENSAFGATRNPWDTARIPGGSSGGSAAAVAADEAIAALGSDTGGSIRQPASFCGVVGLKPTYGRVSRYGLVAYASSLDQIGPITKTVRDAAILLEAVAGHDRRDSTSVDRPVPSYEDVLGRGVRGMRLGLPEEYFVGGLDREVEREVRTAVARLEGDGAEIVGVSLPHTEYAVATYYIIATAEASANLARFDGVRYGLRAEGSANPLEMYGTSRARGFGPEVKRRIILGTYVLSSGYHDAYYLRAQKARTLVRRDFEQAFQRCDALLTPAYPTAAFRLGEKADDPLQMYLGDIFTISCNLAGICGVSVPCGFTGGGLPVGLQILGPAFGEEEIFAVAESVERGRPDGDRRPRLGAGAGIGER